MVQQLVDRLVPRGEAGQVGEIDPRPELEPDGMLCGALHRQLWRRCVIEATRCVGGGGGRHDGGVVGEAEDAMKETLDSLHARHARDAAVACEGATHHRLGKGAQRGRVCGMESASDVGGGDEGGGGVELGQRDLSGLGEPGAARNGGGTDHAMLPQELEEAGEAEALVALSDEAVGLRADAGVAAEERAQVLEMAHHRKLHPLVRHQAHAHLAPLAALGQLGQHTPQPPADAHLLRRHGTTASAASSVARAWRRAHAALGAAAALAPAAASTSATEPHDAAELGAVGCGERREQQRLQHVGQAHPRARRRVCRRSDLLRDGPLELKHGREPHPAVPRKPRALQ